jgi:hypothetical protein
MEFQGGMGKQQLARGVGGGTRANQFAHATRIQVNSIPPFEGARLGNGPDGRKEETSVLELRLRTGGMLRGVPLDHTEQGIVLMAAGVPWVFAWSEIEPGSAIQIRRHLLELERGGTKNLRAEDYFALGVFTLELERSASASAFFRQAVQLDRNLEPRVEEAFRSFRERGRGEASSDAGPGFDPIDRHSATESPGLVEKAQSAVEALERPIPAGPNGDTAGAIEAVYRQFGRTAQEVISKNIVLIESRHFLIWTDWDAKSRGRLAEACEGMYEALCREWNVDPATNVFLAKCPVFCFRAKPRFRDFARLFDGHDVSQSLGYCRSIEANGHVHVVLLRQGETQADFDRFATTLVHEGTHAFLHRVHRQRLIPHWVNEGYADLMAERILGDRCPTGENAELLARQYVQRDWPIEGMLLASGPIELPWYPVAQSVVAWLEAEDPAAFRGFLRSLKEGRSIPAALADNYEGMNVADLERRWRSSVAARLGTADQPSVQP